MNLLPAPNICIILSLITAICSLFTPLISWRDSTYRTAASFLTTILFLISVIVIDFLYLHHIRLSITIFQIDQFDFTLHIEAIGLIFLNLLGVLWIFANLFTIKFLSINNIPNSSRFLFFMYLCMICGIIISMSANLITMFVFYELLTLSTIPLITHLPSAKVTKGLFAYLKILMGSSLVFFLPAIIIIYIKTGHGTFTPHGFISPYFSESFTLLLLLMFVFGISKTALFPMHNWLPEAMVATYPVSALLHAVVVVKTGLFCIYKVLYYVFGIEYLHSIVSSFYFNWLLLLPIITIIYSSVYALKYHNIKKILAYSTINQLNIALLSAFIFTPKGMIAAIMHMVSHAFTKICLFYAMGNIYTLTGATRIRELMSIHNIMPKNSFILFIAALSLIGVPPFGGFISKFYIMLAAAEVNNLLIMITIAISSVISAIYMLKILIFVYKPSRNNLQSHTEYKSEKKLPYLLLFSVSCCLCGVIFFLFIHKGISIALEKV